MNQQIELIKDIDEARRVVVFAYSAFGVKDSDGDVIESGAYAKSIRERGPEGADRIYHLWEHNKDGKNPPIGKVLRLWEDSEYAYAESQMAAEGLGFDIWRGYLSGRLKEHSFAGKAVQAAPSGSGRIIKEVMLKEVSTVIWGANEKALLRSLLKGESADLEPLVKSLKDVQDFVRNSDASDNFLIDIQVEANKVESLLKALRPQEPAPKPTPIDEAALIDLWRML